MKFAQLLVLFGKLLLTVTRLKLHAKMYTKTHWVIFDSGWLVRGFHVGGLTLKILQSLIFRRCSNYFAYFLAYILTDIGFYRKTPVLS